MKVWKTFSGKVNENITGVHDLYFVFQDQNITAGRELFNFDHWVFIH